MMKTDNDTLEIELGDCVERGEVIKAKELLEKLSTADTNFNNLFYKREIDDCKALENKKSTKLGLMHLAVKAPGENLEMLDLLDGYGINPYQMFYKPSCDVSVSSRSGRPKIKWVSVNVSMPTPVEYATKLNKPQILSWFQVKGVKLSAKFESGNILFDLATEYGSKEALKFLFEEGGAQLHIDGVRQYPLQKAADHSLDMLKFVVDFACEKGISLDNCVSKTLQRSLRHDVEEYESSKYYEIVKYLIAQFKSSSESLVHSLQKNRWTSDREKLDILEKCYNEVYPDIKKIDLSGECETSQIDVDHIS